MPVQKHVWNSIPACPRRGMKPPPRQRTHSTSQPAGLCARALLSTARSLAAANKDVYYSPQTHQSASGDPEDICWAGAGHGTLLYPNPANQIIQAGRASKTSPATILFVAIQVCISRFEPVGSCRASRVLARALLLSPSRQCSASGRQPHVPGWQW